MPVKSTAAPMHRVNADLALLLAAAIWGTAFVFQKTAMAHVGPLTFIAARCALAALALLPLAWLESRRTPEPVGWPFLSVAGAGGVAFFLAAWLQQWGLVATTATSAGFFTALYVVMTPFIAWVWSGAAPGFAVWPAVALSAVGTWLLGGGAVGGFAPGDQLVMLSAVLWAAHVVITGRASPFRRPIAFTAVQLAIVAVLATVGAAICEAPTLDGLAAAGLDIAYVGLLSSALTFTLLTVALQHTPPSEAAVIVSLETVFAALGGYLILGERLSGLGLVGAALILLAILCIQLGPALAARQAPG
jgi:drug/metabolite transporter (DMT)-like permease